MNKTKKPRIRFKGFTDDWEQRKLGDIATFINGRAYSQTELLDEGKYRVLRVGNFYTNDSWYYSNIELPERYYANDGDLLYTWSATFGPHIWHGEKVIYHYHIWKIELANTGKKHFMVQLLDRDKEALLAGHNGSTMIHITKSGMEQKHVMIPVDATEQDKIGVFFTYLDKTITLHQRKCEKLKIIKKSMIENCFPKNGQKVPKIRFSGFTGDWEQRKLGHIVGRVTRKNKDLVSNLPLTISAQYGLIDQNEFFDKRIASKDVSNYYLIHKGEFAYNKSTSTDAPWGAIKRLDRYENGVLSTLYIIFRILDENQVDSDYLASYYNTALWYKSIRMIAAEGARNHGLLNIAPDDFFETTLMIPRDIAEQKKIGAYLKNLDDLITLHQRKLNLWKFCKNRSKVMDDFDKEVDFEAALITALQRYGWGQDVIKYPTEKELIQNWANILFENNRSIDRLGDFPLVQEEIDDLLEQINRLRTPLALNGFINGKTVSITRKNPKDTLHYGKEVSLKIYDRMEIAAGQSRYQIVQQPRFARHEKVLQDRRGDLMLLINGMPVFHIELKKSGVPVIEAANQIEKYAHEGLFTGFFSLIQIFVAMNPTETLYFSNPGPDGRFNPDFYFHCADLNNDPINDWKRVAELLLSIPMAHQLVGFYTVADDADGVLKVMRSYQYYAANRISDRVAKHDWEEGNQLGGYIWHTTGSGKTMTSFKSAQLIAASKDADKVVFLMDRIELGTQSLKEYRAFADNADDVQETEDTVTLISKMKSNDPKNTLIVSSIQKMSNIKDDAEVSMKAKDLEAMKSKRLVFIIDECHRSTFGEMLSTIKATFPHALFFGFTGTPVFRENEKVMTTTADIFGDELHRYSIADGIRDKNVLGFDPTMVMVYKDNELRKKVALQESGASSEEEAVTNPSMSKKYYHFMSPSEVPMAGQRQEDGKYLKGIEDYVGDEAWQTDEYEWAIVDNIAENWLTLSRNHKFHALFATSSIPEAVRYYRKFREKYPKLKVTGLFDPTIDNQGGKRSLDKEDGLKAMLEDYNKTFGQCFDIGGYAKFKKDVSARLAHKKPYERVEPEMQLDLLIVVNQMLTGFDSKWINVLYLDKVLVYQNLIQAFSRTNRLFNINEKPFGSIRYYRMPHTMKRNIEDAVQLYSGDRPQGLFADHLPDNVRHMNVTFADMVDIFKNADVPAMDRLPEDLPSKAKFAKLFREFSTYLQAARIQGFTWDKTEYSSIIDAEDTSKEEIIHLLPTEEQYNILLQRYKELRKPDDGNRGDDDDITFPIDPYLTEQNTGVIDNDYMNSRFEKWRKQLSDPNADPAAVEATLTELHKSFAFLSQEEQKYANLFLHDVQTGDVCFTEGKTFRDYIVEYASNAKRRQERRLSDSLGCSEELLQKMMDAHVTKDNLNEYGRFDELKATVVREKAQKYFTKVDGKSLPPFRVNNRVDELLTKFILEGGIDIPDPDEEEKS
ncbi:type I restriction endonuclease subunit R, EcoR124 family [Megasphaera massiliensis]|uniref:type I restriction endonuclease subunit R, EcoR124 family n=1 Tax=Megasphaera massiliensis TaxID=1232428 RepID=UPI000417BB38|nr:HsdR family type I site-specific deoxyribonuclease [Megasphaera massiliensis]MBS6255732.1 HsdR family type I site-specific deoxyribonuclease [Megasphaera sp.]